MPVSTSRICSAIYNRSYNEKGPPESGGPFHRDTETIEYVWGIGLSSRADVGIGPYGVTPSRIGSVGTGVPTCPFTVTHRGWIDPVGAGVLDRPAKASHPGLARFLSIALFFAQLLF